MAGLATSLSLVITRHRAERGRIDRRSFHFPSPHILHLTICAENRERLVASPIYGLPICVGNLLRRYMSHLQHE